MKRYHEIELAGEKLKLSLSFETSLNILEGVESPSVILQSAIDDHRNRVAGRQPIPGAFRLNEKNTPKILQIANKDFEGLNYQRMGDLCFRQGFFDAMSLVIGYITALTSSYAEIETDSGPGDQKEGN